MLRKRPLLTSMLLGAFLTSSTVLTGCASGPRYGAARKSRKGCDCPHWNAVPKQDEQGMWSKMNDPARTATNATRN
jgi:outer membrane murein-binding lipoprotein Lpp